MVPPPFGVLLTGESGWSLSSSYIDGGLSKANYLDQKCVFEEGGGDKRHICEISSLRILPEDERQ